MYLCLAELRHDGSDEKRQFDYDESPASRGFCFPAIRQGYSRGALHQYPCHIVEDQSLAQRQPGLSAVKMRGWWVL